MTAVQDIAQRATDLSDDEKLQLADELIAQVGLTPGEHQEIWANEVLARHRALREGRLTSVPYEEFAERFRRK